MRSLEQVFTNLISNAVEAMSSTGGTLAIRITSSDIIANRPQVEITVSDSGPGIPDDIRERLFEPFVTSKTHGNGLRIGDYETHCNRSPGNNPTELLPRGHCFPNLFTRSNGE
jgi:sensor histidine kinase regulating citrate/malate metabolism